ncbi:DUF4390 domain-containing protein [Pulveribacter suum]|uniref:DUF4390 domain-containing protein n=1 Tax=Pulveribacter suum TaxID=2116657 RepID=A0A2P1NPH2_9BURK|nr:DUF4390 domain-containing protein [Pulveribacter suum]
MFAMALALAGGMPGSAAAAQQHGEITDMRVERTPEGLLLSAAWRLDLPSLVETALYQGIAMHFVAEAQVLRPRWYWSDRMVARATRYLRLSYQPLTRRWRLVQASSAQDLTGLGMALGQSFDELPEALAAMQRLARWKIAEADELDDERMYEVSFQFRLDTSQLPRPLQFGTLGKPGWAVALARRVELPPAEAAQ